MQFSMAETKTVCSMDKVRTQTLTSPPSAKSQSSVLTTTGLSTEQIFIAAVRNGRCSRGKGFRGSLSGGKHLREVCGLCVWTKLWERLFHSEIGTVFRGLKQKVTREPLVFFSVCFCFAFVWNVRSVLSGVALNSFAQSALPSFLGS